MPRPADTWRICNQPVVVPDDPNQRGRGCACSGYELFNDKFMIQVMARLSEPSGDLITDPGNPSSPPRVP